MNLNPTWSTGDRLSPVLGTPSLDETHAYGTHSGQLIDSLKPVINRLRQLSRKLLVVEYFQITAWWDLTNCGWMPSIALVAVWTLNKHGTVTETFGKHLTANVIESNTFTNMSSCHLDLLSAIDIRQKPKTESFAARWVRKAINRQRRL
jgi:hypothetical protein